MIIDCFPYFKEKEILELRIKLLYDKVDRFIICDGNYTQSGIPKEYSCKKTLKELGIESDKIIVVEVDMPGPELEWNSWVRERIQRDAAAQYIEDDSVCFVGDCDEIINPEVIEYYSNVAKSHPDNILRVPLANLNGRADLRVYDEYGNPVNWRVPFMCLKQHLEKYTLSEIRESHAMFKSDILYKDVFITENGIIQDAGWHFSWMGNSDVLKEKCKASMHVFDEVVGSAAPLGSDEMMKFIDGYSAEENATDPLGRKHHVLKKYPLSSLPQKIFELPRVKNFLLPTKKQKFSSSKVKIVFHDNQLGERGTSVSLYDYAYYGRKYFNIEPIIVFNKFAEYNNVFVIEKFKREFEVIPYENFSDVESIINNKSAEYFYAIKEGKVDDIIVSNAINLIHSVYSCDPSHIHGDRYATVSEWQSSVHNNVIPYVPHMLNLPDTDGNLREHLGIPNDAIVFGRYGGLDTFDVPFINESIAEILEEKKDFWFILMNTPKIINHERCLYFDANVDLEYKSKFINTCDAMIHGGFRGETFGISVLEFATKNKQIITFDNYVGGRNHHLYLKDNYHLYSNKENLKDIFENITKDNPFDTRYLISKFSSANVMKKFKEVFLT